MAPIKLVEWNIGWLNDLFKYDKDGNAQFLPDGCKTTHDSKVTVAKRREEIVGALNDLDADVVVMLEAPKWPKALELFFQQPDLNGHGNWKTHLQVTRYDKWKNTADPKVPPECQQEEPDQVDPQPGEKENADQNIGIAVRTDKGVFTQECFNNLHDTLPNDFDNFLEDIDDDGIKELYRFARSPLYVEIYPQNGAPFRLMGLHLKSKLVASAYEWSKWWATADANRRKILAETTHIRLDFLDPYLTDKLGNTPTSNIPLIVCGDINDGPGMDASEKRLLGSGVERLMGNVWIPELCLGNALFDTLDQKNKAALNFYPLYTTEFRDPIFNNVTQKEWIDHVLYTKAGAQAGTPWVSSAKIHKEIIDNHNEASDHYPVSVLVTS